MTREEWTAAVEAALETIETLTHGGGGIDAIQAQIAAVAAAIQALEGRIVGDETTARAELAKLQDLMSAIPDATTPVPAPTPTPTPTPTPPPSGKEIVCYHRFASDFWTTLAPQYGAAKASILYQSNIDTGKDGKFDGLTSGFKSRIQGAPQGAVMAIDWEHAFGTSGGFLKALCGQSGAAEQAAALPEALRVINEIRALRPDLRIGYYKVPFYWSYTHAATMPAWWLAQETTLQTLFDKSDVLMPEIYQYFDIGSGTNPATGKSYGISEAEDAKRMGNMAALALRCAKGKPILPFVWELYHPAGNVGSSTVIAPDQMFKHINAYAKAGANCSGFYWWGTGAGPNGTEAHLKVIRQALGG